MRKKLVTLALLLALLSLAGCGEAPVEIPELLEPVGVQSDKAAVRLEPMYRLETYDAYVRPHVQALSFEVDGRVSRVLFYPGMEFRAGDVLAELDQSSEASRAEALRRELDFLDQDYAYTDALYALDVEIMGVELEQLRAEGADDTRIALLENDIEQLRAEARQARLLRQPELEAKRQELEALEARLEQGVLRAPFSGRVVYCDLELTTGSPARAYAPVVFLADDSRLSLYCQYINDLTLASASRVCARVGAVEYDVEVVPVAHDDYVAAALSGATLESEFRLTGPAEALDQLEAGQYGALQLVRGYIPDALVVPSGAVLHESGGRYVYVDENGERVRRAVRTGMVTDIATQIVEGLEEGEVVYVND